MKKDKHELPGPSSQVRQVTFHEEGEPKDRRAVAAGQAAPAEAAGADKAVGTGAGAAGRSRVRRRRKKGLSPLGQRRKRPLFLSSKQALLWAFLLPVLILTASYLTLGIFPFIGEKTSLTIDLYHQYAPFLAGLRDKLVGGGNLFYDWNIGLGTNFLALTAYYLGSPLNVLLLLFPAATVSDAVIILTLIKVGLAGLTFAHFLRRAYCFWGVNSISTGDPTGPVNKKETATHFALVLAGAFYALSGFVITFAWNIMWLDGVVLFPLVMLGVHRLIREGKFLLYSLTLAAALVINYYVAMFICIFTVPYFFVAYFSLAPYLKPARVAPVRYFAKRAGQMVLFTLLAVAISAVMTLPTYLALTHTSAMRDQFPEVWNARFSLFEFMGRHMVGVAPSIREGLPNIYAGVLTFALLPLYTVAKHIRLQERLLHMGLLVFLFLSFNINGLDFIWHGLHYPNQLPYRYSFVYVFLVLVMGFRLLMGLRQLKKSAVTGAFAVGLVYAVLAEVVTPEAVDHATVYLTIIIVALYFLFTLTFLRGQETLHRTAALIAIICVAELCINSIMSLSAIDSKEYFTRRQDFNNDIAELRAAVAELEKQDPDFWRLEMVQQKTTNSPALYNYRGFTIFSSTSAENTARFMRSLGFHGNNINSYKYTASTAPLNAIFNIRYLLNKESVMDDPLLQEVAPAGEQGHIYRQEGVLPVGFGVPAGIAGWRGEELNPFVNQNRLFQAAGAAGELLQPLDLTIQNIVGAGAGNGTAVGGYTVDRLAGQTGMTFEASLTVRQDQHVYFYFDPDKAADFELSYHSSQPGVGPVEPVEPGSVEAAAGAETGQNITTVNINEQEMVDAGFRKAGDVVRVKVTAKEDGAGQVRLMAAGLDMEAYRLAVADWGSQGLQVEQFTDNHLSGAFNLTQPGYLFLSIPYDAAWQVEVDGVPVQAEPLADGLTLVPAGAGEHRLSMTFVPPRFYVGVGVTSVGLVVLFILFALTELRRRRQPAGSNFDFDRLLKDHLGPVSAGFVSCEDRPGEALSKAAVAPDIAAGFTEVGEPAGPGQGGPTAEAAPELLDWDWSDCGAETADADNRPAGQPTKRVLAAKSRPAWQRALGAGGSQEQLSASAAEEKPAADRARSAPVEPAVTADPASPPDDGKSETGWE